MKKTSVVLITLSVLLSIFIIAVPQNIQLKIWNKLIIPYKYFYVRDLEQIIDTRRNDMAIFYSQEVTHGKEAYIAHGGGVGYYCKKECKEGIEDALNKGFKYIEIDFLETVDGHLFGGYDWYTFSRLVGREMDEVQKMTLSEIQELKINGKHSVLTAKDIVDLLNKNKNWYLVTDHTRNFELLMKEIPMPERLLVETIGGLYDYKRAIEAGVRYPMYTAGDINLVEKYEFPVIVVNAELFSNPDNAERLQHLYNKGITIFVWNSKISDHPDFISTYLGNGISKIYTDKWHPSGKSPLKN